MSTASATAMKTPETEHISSSSSLTDGPENGNSHLKQIVRESQEKLANSGLQAPKIKRKPGRPKKNPVENPGAAPVSGQSQPNPVPIPTPPPEIGPIIAPAIQSLSNIPAVKYQIPELSFTIEETKACADSIQGLVDAFFPDLNKMSPQAAALLGFGLTAGSIAVSKLNIYAHVIEMRRQERAAANGTTTTTGPVDQTPTLAPGARPASELFR